MGENIDKVKGRAKQAAGDLTDNDELRNEGRTDETAGKAKSIVNDIKDKADDGRCRRTASTATIAPPTTADRALERQRGGGADDGDPQHAPDARRLGPGRRPSAVEAVRDASPRR